MEDNKLEPWQEKVLEDLDTIKSIADDCKNIMTLPESEKKYWGINLQFNQMSRYITDIRTHVSIESHLIKEQLDANKELH